MHCILFGPFHSYITKKWLSFCKRCPLGSVYIYCFRCEFIMTFYGFIKTWIFFTCSSLLCIWIHGYFLHSFQFIGIVCGKEYVRGLFKILLSISDVIEKRLFASKEKSSHMEWNDHSFQSIKNVMSELKAFLVYGVFE